MTIARNQVEGKSAYVQRKIFVILLELRNVGNTSVTLSSPGDYTKIQITSPLEYVPDLELEWCSEQKHYRVYMHQANRVYAKCRQGYSFVCIKGPLAAMDLVQMVRFIHRNRANNKG